MDVKETIEGKKLLTEVVNRKDLIDAIKNRKVIYIYYAGHDDKSNNGRGVVTKGFRTIEPYLIGVTKPGNLVLRAWQQNGASDSNKGINRTPRPDHDILPGWRLFYVDGITSMLLTGKKFSTAKNKIRPKYNPDDKQMKEIIYAIDPEVGDIEVDGLGSIEDSDEYIDKMKVFDKQAKKFKNFYDDKKNRQKLFKKKINDFYELITKHRKKSPRDYYLVYNDNGNIVAVTEKRKNKYKDENVIGNLKDLFVKYNKFNRPTKAFFDRQREMFKKSLNK